MIFNGKNMTAFFAGYSYDPKEAVEETAKAMESRFAPCIEEAASGETVVLTDASESALRGLTIYGKTTQDGTPTPENPVELVNIGVKNYLPKTEYTLDGSGIYLTLPAGDYTLSFDAPPSTPPTTIAFYDAAGATLFSKTISASLRTTIAINLSSEATSMVIAPRDPYTITNAMLTKGSICVTVAGNNLFDKENAETVGGYIDPDGNITANASFGTTWFVPVSENTKYTISTNSPGGFYFRAIGFLDSAKSLIGFDGKDTNTYGTVFTGGKTTNFFATATFTTPKGCKYVQVGSLKENWGSDSTIMLNCGNAALPYEPYKEIQTITASTPNGLPGIPVSSGGNYTDENGQQWICDEIDFARGVYVQRIGLFDANSGTITRTMTTDTSGYNRFVLADNALKASASSAVGVVMCSIASAISADNTYRRVEGIAVDSANGYVVLYIAEIAQMTSGDALTWLKGKNAKVLYALANPIETALSAEELAAYAALHTNKPNTTVLNDAGAGMDAKYVADTKAYIDNQFTELRNAILSAGANV